MRASVCPGSVAVNHKRWHTRHCVVFIPCVVAIFWGDGGCVCVRARVRICVLVCVYVYMHASMCALCVCVSINFL